VRGAEGEAWEVWNAGVPRYSVLQMLAWFRRAGRAAAPRIVVVLPRGWDHVTPACVKSDEECLGVLSGTGSAVKVASFLELRFPRWLGLAPAPGLPPVVRPATPELLDGWRTRRQRPNGPRVSPVEFKRALRVLRDEVLSSGARLVFVNSPSRAVMIQGFPELSDYVGILETVAGERGVPVVHAREEFNLESDQDEKHFFDDLNLTADAHARLAQSVSWCLANLGVQSLPKAATPGTPTRQVELRPLLEKARLTHPERKTPLDLAPFLDAGMQDVVAPSPSLLTLERLTLGASTLLRFRLSLIEPVRTASSPNGAPSRSVRVAVYVLTPAGERRRVFIEESNRSDWSRLLDLGARTIDLSEFAGEAVQLELEVLGDSLYVDWGRPSLVSYEPKRG
jgi:hypothetical protein